MTYQVHRNGDVVGVTPTNGRKRTRDVREGAAA